MRRARTIFSICFIILGTAGAALLFRSLRASPPASIIFLCYTNRQKSAEELRAVGDEPEAVWRLTNHTAVSLKYQVTVDAFKVGRADSMSSCDASGKLEGHESYYFNTVTPGGTNEWRFLVVTAISTGRPRWQQHLAGLLVRAGVHLTSLNFDRTYPQSTNVWTTP
jgi:hypothetical protein